MIYISCGVSQEYVIETLEKSEEAGITFKYEGKTGIKLAFSVNTEDLDQAIAVAKQVIKATPTGSVLFLQYSK